MSFLSFFLATLSRTQQSHKTLAFGSMISPIRAYHSSSKLSKRCRRIKAILAIIMVRIASVLSFGFVSSLAAAAPLQFSARSGWDVKSAALSYVAQKWQTSSYEVWFDSASASPSGTTAVVRQATNDQPVWNSYANVHFDSSNKVVNFSSQHFDISYVEQNMPTIAVEDAVAAGEKALNAKWTDTDFEYTEPDHLGYIAVGNRAKYSYILHFESNTDSTPLTAYISAVNGEVDWVVNSETGATISSVSA
ncbi:hypothetical protein BXZ70DRAFT_308885 [Cristinia sonorae]|uniref:Uncharacterized protein n=1 Tax=Cristinia sonorae TaxID=1940300 RepID=A0A8K0UM46_9AGAR|nr:hypothetical protein BXZ70DRAFT_308885 [Cristinia sonorae]